MALALCLTMSAQQVRAQTPGYLPGAAFWSDNLLNSSYYYSCWYMPPSQQASFLNGRTTFSDTGGILANGQTVGTGSYTVNFAWNGGPSNVPPPATAYWCITVNADAQGNSPMMMSSNGTVQDIAGNEGQYVSSKQLVQQGGNTATFTENLGISGSNGDHLDLTLFSVTPDTRGLNITGPVTSGKVPEMANGVQQTDQYGNLLFVPGSEPHSTGGDWFGDIGIMGGAQGEPQNTQNVTYSAAAVGGWDAVSPYSSTYSWSSSMTGETYSGSTNLADQDIPSFDVTYEGQGADSTIPGNVGKDTVTVSCTAGSDGATATANCDMIIHNSVDGTHEGTTTQPQEDVQPALDVASPGYAVQNGTIGVTFNWWMGYVGDALTGGSAAATNPVIAAALALLGIAASSSEESASAVYDNCFTDSRSTFSGAPVGVTANSSNESDWTMVPVYNMWYSPHMVISDQWGSSGYTGQAFTTIYKFNGSQYFTGHFAWNTGVGQNPG